MSNPTTRGQLFEKLSIVPERVCRVTQQHTRCVVVTHEQLKVVGQPSDSLPADGLIAQTTRDVLCMTVADCLPIFLIPQDGQLPALLHSGWRGTGIVTDALAYLKTRFDRSPSLYHAIIGPGIGPCCYNVPLDRALRFRDQFGPDVAEVVGETGRIDLQAANIALLGTTGVSGITVYEDCTACSTALHSFRAERASGHSGNRRMAALLGNFRSP